MGNIIFSTISEKRLREVLQNLHNYTELPIRLIDVSGETVLSYGDFPKYCTQLQSTVFTEKDCVQAHMKAGQRALNIGEAYIFPCHGNLNHIAFPLINGGTLIGSVIIGPFLLDKPDSTVVIGLDERYPLNPALSLELYDCLLDIPVMLPAKVNNLKVLTDYLLSALIPTERILLLHKQQEFYQQSKMNETIQVYKEGTVSSDLKYRYEKEKKLLSVVKTGNTQAAKELLNDLIGNVLFNGGGVDAIRPRAVELTTLLSRVAMDGGANPDKMYELSSKYIYKLYQEDRMEKVCMILQEVLENFMNAAFYDNHKGNAYIRKALCYIGENFRQHITLEMTAEHVGLSPNYFSTLFRSVMGTGFSDYLNNERIEEGKRMLLMTDYAPTDIAMFLGFPDQSYFCKVFKKITGTTPGQFRNSRPGAETETENP